MASGFKVCCTVGAWVSIRARSLEPNSVKFATSDGVTFGCSIINSPVPMGEKKSYFPRIMIEIHRSALVLVSAEKLYQLINDIESYPLFLDGVSSATILEQDETQMLGRLIVKKAGFEKTLVTRNKLTNPSRIEMNLEEGPLDYLNGIWTIQSINDSGCKVSLDLTFQAARGLKMMAFSAMFKQVADSMVSSFVDRAHSLYGR